MKFKLAYFGDGIEKACYHAGNREKKRESYDGLELITTH